MKPYSWCIWKASPTAQPAFALADELPKSGFRSVYQFAEADASSMAANGFAKWRGVVWSPMLFLDIDRAEELDGICNRLEHDGIAHDVYSTGNRGAHIHIPRMAEPSHRLPEIDKQYAQSLGGVDISFYHSVGMYRCVGARHVKTGQRKELIHSVPGKLLDLRAVILTSISLPLAAPPDGPFQSVFASSILQTLAVPWAVGERHRNLVRIACELRRLGQSYEFSFGYMQNVALMAEEPKSDEEIKKVLDWAWEQT